MKRTERLVSRLTVSIAAGMALVWGATLHAQTQPGKAEVREVKGTSHYSVAGGPWTPLLTGASLRSGSSIKTESGSAVDLFLGKSAGTVRVTEKTTLGLDTLTLTETGADTVVEVQLHLPEGTILGKVGKLAAASKYEIKMPCGMLGIKGGLYQATSPACRIVSLDDTAIIAYVAPGVPAKIHPIPPGHYFTPVEGVKSASGELLANVREAARPIPALAPPGPLPAVPYADPFVSPGLGATPPTPR